MKEALKLADLIQHFDSNDESLPLELLKEIAATLRALAQPELLMKRPVESEYTSQVAYTRALEAYCDSLAQPEPFGHWHWEQPMTKPLQGWFVKGPSDGKLNGVAGIALYTAPLLPEQEPVAKYIGECNDGSLVQLYEDVTKGTVFYTTPPKRPWVGLTEARIKELWLNGKDHGDDWLDVLVLARAFEAELKEKNT